MNAIILAAGLGTRLGDLTSDRPKALVTIAGRTMLEHQIRHLKKAGFDHIVINIHHFSNLISDFIKKNDFGIDIKLSDETDMLLDTGGGIRMAMELFDDNAPILVNNVDIFSDTDLKEFYNNHLESNADATLLVADRKTSRHLHFDDSGNLCGWSNDKNGQIRSPYANFKKEKCHPAAFQGIQVISGSISKHLNQIAEAKFSIVDFYVENAPKLSLKAIFAPKSSQWVDAGKVEYLQKAEDIIRTYYDK
jgi:N-acetyl-alpha-D-muramate 1-phosphate uridylyltransferase